MGLTLQQQQLGSILPHITGFMSWLGSLSIIVDVVRRFRRADITPKSYDRLMMGMSLCDMCASGAWMMSTWPIPADQPNVYANYGTDASCSTQGFFIQLGIGVPFYNLCLSIYYYLVIVRAWPSQLGRTVEGCMHFVSVGYAVSTAISALALDLFGYAGFWCWIQGQHKIARWVFWYGPLWVIIAMVSAIMFAIYCSLVKQEKRQLRWIQNSETGNNIPTVMPGTADSNRNNEHSIPRSRNRSATRASKSMKWQAFWYLGSFFLTWIFLTIVRGMQTTGTKPIPYWILLAAVTLCPSQGFFNFLIYIRPRYDNYRRAHPEVGKLATFIRIHPLYAAGKSFRGTIVQSLHGQRVSINVGNSRIGKSLQSIYSRGKHDADASQSALFDIEECGASHNSQENEESRNSNNSQEENDEGQSNVPQDDWKEEPDNNKYIEEENDECGTNVSQDDWKADATT